MCTSVPAGVDDEVAEVGRERGVGEREHLAGARIEAGVRGHGRHHPVDLAVVVPGADGLEIGGDLGGQPTLPQRVVAAGVADDVGVGRVLDRSGVTGDRLVGPVGDVGEPRVDAVAGADLDLETLGEDPAVAVRGLAVVEGDLVQHAVAVEHVVVADRLEHRVRTVADEPARRALGEVADDREVGLVELGLRRSPAAGQVGVAGLVGHVARSVGCTGHVVAPRCEVSTARRWTALS